MKASQVGHGPQFEPAAPRAICLVSAQEAPSRVRSVMICYDLLVHAVPAGDDGPRGVRRRLHDRAHTLWRCFASTRRTLGLHRLALLFY